MSVRKLYPMYKWISDLFPFHRSLVSKENLKTLNYLKKINHNLKIKYFNSGKKVFDWVIPDEWVISEAYFLDKNKKKYCNFKNNNLHILQYSAPINKTLSKEELLKNLYSIPEQPNAIPYVTSFYKKNWGFCIQDKIKKKLPSGKYKVLIKSNFKKGKMYFGEIFKKGKLKKEVFFSTYICHPSMANNELSGPALNIAISKYLNKNYNKSNFSYRFAFIPETIGSISYIHKNKNKLKKNIIAGFNCSCVGDNGFYSHTSSRVENSLADRALKASLIGKKIKKYSFLDRGSDERQYCSPGIDLPVCGFSRSRFGSYKEYHTSLDNLDFVSQKGLTNSFIVLKNIIDAFEFGLYPKTKYLCEPKLDKRGLYNFVSFKKNYGTKIVKDYMDILAYSDGKISIFDIAIKLNKNLYKVVQSLKTLKEKGLII